MKHSKLMKERIKRVQVLFKELGYTLFNSKFIEDTFSAEYEKDDITEGALFIDRESKFLEIAFTFSFSTEFDLFIQKKLEDMLKACYEFGCYMNIQKDEELSFSIFSKIYFAGLNFYSLKETLRDFDYCILTIKEIIEITKEDKSLL